jgi:hypothetical protein
MNEIKTTRTLWTREETASHLKKSLRTVDRLIRLGRIEAFKFNNRSVLIYEDSVIERNITSPVPKFNNKV